MSLKRQSSDSDSLVDDWVLVTHQNIKKKSKSVKEMKMEESNQALKAKTAENAPIVRRNRPGTKAAVSFLCVNAQFSLFFPRWSFY